VPLSLISPIIQDVPIDKVELAKSLNYSPLNINQNMRSQIFEYTLTSAAPSVQIYPLIDILYVYKIRILWYTQAGINRGVYIEHRSWSGSYRFLIDVIRNPTAAYDFSEDFIFPQIIKPFTLRDDWIDIAAVGLGVGDRVVVTIFCHTEAAK